jgi:NADPH:quinone reductase-like Zn-dependent oxidoreductase
VLVNGAGGGMGTFAVQMARARGAEVTGVDAGPKLEMIRSIGADHVVDYGAQDVTRLGERYDLILDVQARRSVRDWRRALAPDGAYLMVGGSTRRILQGALYGQYVSQTSDMTMGILPGWPHSRRDMEDVNGLIEAGSVRPVIDRTYPLDDAAQALRYVKSGEALGKVVIRVADA